MAGLLPELTNVLQQPEYKRVRAGEDLSGKSALLADPLSFYRFAFCNFFPFARTLVLAHCWHHIHQLKCFGAVSNVIVSGEKLRRCFSPLWE